MISGGEGKDNFVVRGFNKSNDIYLLGGLGRDRLIGGNSTDILVDGDNQNWMNSNPNNHREVLRGNLGDDVIIENKGSDDVGGGDGGDLLMSTDLCNNDIIRGGRGADNSQWAQLPQQTNLEDGRHSSDTGIYANLPGGTIGKYKRGTGQVGCGNGNPTQIFGIERIEASGNPDYLIGDSDRNFLLGRSGRDVFLAGPDVDLINAFEGNENWHRDDVINCQEDGGSALWGGSDLDGDVSNCRPRGGTARYGADPPKPYEETGDFTPTTQASFLGEEVDSEPDIDQAGTLMSSWESGAPSPSAYFQMNELSGDEVQNRSDPGDPGSYLPSSGGPDLAEEGTMLMAPDQEAVALDGNDDSIELLSSIDPGSETDGYSVEMWAGFTDDDVDPGDVLFARGDQLNGIKIYVTADYQVAFETRYEGSVKRVKSFDADLETEWHHVVAVIDGHWLSIYVDGIEYYVGFDGPVRPGLTPNADDQVGTTSTGTAHTEMIVDSVSIFKESLNAVDVIERYADGSELPPRYILLGPESLTDTDSDILPDDQDNCPSVANPNQTDSDEDGIGDPCDTDNDSDGDLIQDGSDNCPDDYNPGQEDLNADGVGDECEDAVDEPANEEGGD